MRTLIIPMSILISAAAAASQEAPKPAFEKKTYTIARAASAIRVDAVLDEEAWSRATVVPLEYEWYPGDNTPAPVRTEALLTFDSDALYLAFKASDPRPAEIRAHLTDRDTPFLDDTVGFMLDPFNDERRAFQFRVNALGVQMEAVNSDVDFSEDWSWDAIWTTAGRITSEGYIVEVAIPFRSLRFPRTTAVQTWGFKVMRDYPRSLRHRMQSGKNDRSRNCNACQFDKITGFEGITPGRDLELDPTVTSTRTDARRDFPAGDIESGDIGVEGGLTAKWGITPNVTLNGAINPDFSHVEADVAQLSVNNRFALFFPEKRPFFLEGADFFQTPLSAVFTRTVADPSWGLKATGKEGRHAFGVFVAEDQVNNLIFPSNQGSGIDSVETDLSSGVFRYRTDIGETSTIGALYTLRDGGGYSNHVGGVDGSLRFGRSDSVRFQYLRSTTEYPADLAARNGQATDLEDDAWVVSYNHGDRNKYYYVALADLGPDYRADAGFEPRVDMRVIETGGGYNFYGKPKQWFSRLEPGVSYDRIEDHAGQLTDEGVDLYLSYQGPRQSTAGITLAKNREFFNGTMYEPNRINWDAGIRPSGHFALSLRGSFGGDIDYANGRDADRFQVIAFLEYSLGRHFSGNVSHTLQTLDVAGGQLFEANLTQARMVYNFNVRMFVRAIVQYTDIERNTALYTFPIAAATERVFSQFLFSYKLNPQTVVLAGYSDNYFGDDRIDVTQTDRTLFLKLGYAWLF